MSFNVCRHVKSNAIVLASNETTVGIGSGQPSRLDSCQIAINKMKKFNLSSGNLVAASDAFFPFVDGIEKLVQSGVRAVIQPSGSIRDKEIIKFANETNTVLLFQKQGTLDIRNLVYFCSKNKITLSKTFNCMSKYFNSCIAPIQTTDQGDVPLFQQFLQLYSQILDFLRNHQI